MYHRFSGPPASVSSALSRQFAYIRRHYHPVSLGEVVRCWATGEQFPLRALAITVDDGYADFQAAWSLLKQFQLPATLFVVSGFTSRELWLWPDVVHFCMSHSTRKRIHLDMPDGTFFERSLSAAPDREAADRDLDALLLAMPDESRRDVIAKLPEAAGLFLPDAIPAEYAPLDWDALRKMTSEGLEVGAHTQTHPVLARISSVPRLRQEVAGSKLAIENQLNVPVRHFCYPNGQPADFNSASIDAVRNAGFLSAATAQRGLVGSADSHWEIHRIGVDPLMSTAAFELELAGFRMA
jgi:peptidoglycan/xylan/chitin deacetylase (PgdA/CDA1 family)